MAGTVILITWEQQLSAWLFCKLRLLCKNSLLILKTYKTFLKEIFMRSKYIQRHSHSCLEDSIVKSWLVQLVLSFEVKKCESSTLFFFFLKKKKQFPTCPGWLGTRLLLTDTAQRKLGDGFPQQILHPSLNHNVPVALCCCLSLRAHKWLLLEPVAEQPGQRPRRWHQLLEAGGRLASAPR